MAGPGPSMPRVCSPPTPPPEVDDPRTSEYFCETTDTGTTEHVPQSSSLDEDLSPKPDDLNTCECVCEAIRSGTTEYMFQLDSRDAKPPPEYAPSSENPRLYFSLNHWPESHPTHGSREAVTSRLGQGLREAVREEFYKLPGLPESDAAFIPHIRLAGLVCPVHLTAHFRPTLWVDCASEWVRDVIKRALRQNSKLRWLGSETIIVQNNFVLATSIADFRDAKLDLSHGHDIGQGRKVHFFLENPGRETSACGLRTAGVITHDEVIIEARVDSLGGVLLVHEPVDPADSTGKSVPARYGWSCAHGILPEITIFNSMPSAEDASVKDNSSAKNDSSSLIHTNTTAPSVVRADKFDSAGVSSWVPIPGNVLLDFVQTDGGVGGSLPHFIESGKEHDVALFDFSHALLRGLENKTRFGCETVIGHWDDFYLTAKPQDVTFLNRDKARGQLLTYEFTMCFIGADFELRRVLLEAALSGGGWSGTAVVANPFLCGTVFLRYVKEPMCFIRTTERLLRDVYETKGLEQNSVTFPKVDEPTTLRPSRLKMMLDEWMYGSIAEEVEHLSAEIARLGLLSPATLSYPDSEIKETTRIGSFRGQDLWYYEPSLRLTKRLWQLWTRLRRWASRVDIELFLIGTSDKARASLVIWVPPGFNRRERLYKYLHGDSQIFEFFIFEGEYVG